MKTLSEISPVLEHFGSTTRDASNWIARLSDLSDRLPETVAGSARKFDFLHAVDLVCIAAFVKGGATPSAASKYAASVVRNVRGVGKPSREWLVFPAGRLQSAIGSDKPDPEALVAHFGEVPLSFIPVGAVVRMVRKLYEEA